MFLHLIRNFHVSCVKQLDKKMVRVLSVAEKNDAAKSLSNVLSNGRCTKVSTIKGFNLQFIDSK